MALSIKSEDADRLARELAAVTGESITQAFTVASFPCSYPVTDSGNIHHLPQTEFIENVLLYFSTVYPSNLTK